MDALEIDQQEHEEVVTAAVLAKRLNVVDYENGFALRHCEGPRSFLNWQAGSMISQKRYLPTSRRELHWEWQSVSLFHLLGYGETRSDAIAMAKQNENGRRR